MTDYFLNIYLNTKTVGNGWNAADSKLKGADIKDGFDKTIYVGQGWIDARFYDRPVIPGVSNSIFLGGVPDLARGGEDVVEAGVGPEVELRRDSDRLPPETTLIPWGGPFPQGVLVGFGDAVVKTIPYNTPGKSFGSFLTPANREPVVMPD